MYFLLDSNPCYLHCYQITNMIRRTGLLLLIWFSNVQALAQVPCPQFRVSDTFLETTLQGFLYTLTTTDTSLNNIRRATFVPVTADILSVGYDPRQHWIKCCFTNAGSKPQALVFGVDFAHIDDLSLYVMEQANVLHRWEHLSRQTRLASRPIASRVFAFPIDIAPGQTLTLYGRFMRQRSVLLLPVKLMTQEQFYSVGFSVDLAMFMGLGILLIACLVSLSIFIITHQWSLFYYALYALTYGIAMLSLEGIWGQYVHQRAWLDENTHLVMFSLVAFAQIQFLITSLKLTFFLPSRIILGLRGFAGACLFLAFYLLITPFSYRNSSLLSSWGLLTELLVFSLVAWGWLRGRTGALLLLISELPILLLLVWFSLTILFKLPRHWLFYQAAYTIPFWQLIILGAGLGVSLVQKQREALLAVGQLQRQQAEAIIQTQEAERGRIAADLHDDLGGTLATVRRWVADIHRQLYNSSVSETLDQLDKLVQKSTQDLRRIAYNLMPPEFARFGLCYSLEQLVKKQPAHAPLFSFIVVGTEYRLPLDTELNLYRIVSELMQNIHKHAQASQAAVQLLYFADHLTITVEDDGLGNKSIKTTNAEIGTGLKNSNLRADYIGARIWREVSEAGTLVLLEVPYTPEPDAIRQTKPPFIDR
jgi:signal transduction histidine kinase